MGQYLLEQPAPRQEPCASSASETSSFSALPPLLMDLLRFSGEHPIHFRDYGRLFLETPSPKNGDECRPKRRFLNTGEHQAGPSESPGEEEEHAGGGMPEETKK